MGLLFYYLDKDGVQQGPFNSKQVRELIRIGVILPLTDIRTDQMDRWVHAFNLKNTFPDYVPSQEQPKPPAKSWGTRYALHLVKNPFIAMAIIGVFGMVFSAYRSLELPWLFPPNKSPSPIVDSGDLAAVTPVPEVTKEVEEAEEVTLENDQPKQISGNSTAGQIHRGIMGDQWCIKPCRMFSLPSQFSGGRFFFQNDQSNVIYSDRNTWVNFNKNAWSLPGMMLSNGAFNNESAMCHITSYSQINRHFNTIASSLDGLLVIGGIRDWQEVAGFDTLRNYQINTNIRPLLPYQVQAPPEGKIFAVYKSPKIKESQRINQYTIAVAQSRTSHGTRLKMAISAMQSDLNGDNKGQASNLDAFHRLMVLSPEGRIIAKKDGINLSTLAGNQAAIEKASRYQQLAFSRNSNYLAGYKSNGQIDIYFADTLKLLFTVKGVHMGGPYLRRNNEEATSFVSHRLCFSESKDLLLADDRGQVVLIDLRTEKVRRYPLRGLVQAYCFVDGDSIMAASTETGEVYRIDSDTGEVYVKTLLAGLGPLTAQLNFSKDGNYLSGIFDENLYTVGIPDRLGTRPAVHAIFWNLHHINNPNSKVKNQAVWTCQHQYRDDYPGHNGSFVGFAQPNLGTLAVVTKSEETEEITAIPFRALTNESQTKAILLHSLVEATDSTKLFHPEKSVYSNKIPEWKPIISYLLLADQDERFTAKPSKQGTSSYTSPAVTHSQRLVQESLRFMDEFDALIQSEENQTEDNSYW